MPHPSTLKPPGGGGVQWAAAAVPQHKYHLEPPRSSAGGIKPMYYAWSRSQFRGPASVETADKSSVLIPIIKIGYSGEKLTVGLLWLLCSLLFLASQNESFSSCVWGGSGTVATV